MATKQLFAISAPVTITAGEGEGAAKGPAKFISTFYTGGKLNINGWDMPVVVDLSALSESKVLVANLDHDQTKRVGNFSVANDGRTLVASGTATAKTAARDEVIDSALAGYQWQSSLEVNPRTVKEVKAGKTVTINGQEQEGPFYHVVGTLKGFGFVSHGADDNTTATIAASAASNKEKVMELKPEVLAWAEKIYKGVVDFDHMSEDMAARIEANYRGTQPIVPKKRLKLDDGIEAKQAEADRVEAITDIALGACDKRPYDIKAIQELAQSAIDAKWTIEKFRLELLEAALPPAHTVFSTRKDSRLNNRILEAAICQSGRLPDLEDAGYDDQTLQAAHDRFKGRLGLKQLFLLAAQANGYNDGNMDVTLDVQRAAFGMQDRRQIRAAGFSALDISTILSNTANKFIMRGWNMVDQTFMKIAKIQNVRDFKTITTVSLTDSLRYEQVGNDGAIKHGTLGEITYTNKADTYAKMLAITRQDIINDDQSCLTDVPMKLGNGAMKLLNHIGWTEFLRLVTDSFFAAGNANINTAIADMTLGGLAATETIFMNQTNPDGTPLGLEPKILLVPTALKAAAQTLMTSERIVTGESATKGDGNIWRDRFTVLSSPYISNSSYTGSTSTAWWMLADPNELPVIAIAALNGKVEPTVETADADFNVLGVQMRGYSDVGVKRQEYRAGVHADGGAS